MFEAHGPVQGGASDPSAGSSLATRTEAELMGVKNFGATSLDEVREKLGAFGLGLRELD